MASLTLGSVNFNKAASMSSPDMIVRLADRMRDRGIKPELEIFDLGMVNFAHYLIKKDLHSAQPLDVQAALNGLSHVINQGLAQHLS